jgi:hypothetical protein
MPAVGDKYVLTLTSYEGANVDNPLINVFAYEATDGTPSSIELAAAFTNTVVDSLRDAIASTTQIATADIINLDDPTDFYTSSIGVAGTVVAQYLPRFNGWEFEYQRGTREVHNGRKTFGLVPENYATDGVLDPSGAAAIAALELSLESTISPTSPTSSYTPRIWRRAGTYASGTFLDTFYPIYGVLYRRISTQNTRKR